MLKCAEVKWTFGFNGGTCWCLKISLKHVKELQPKHGHGGLRVLELTSGNCRCLISWQKVICLAVHTVSPPSGWLASVCHLFSPNICLFHIYAPVLLSVLVLSLSSDSLCPLRVRNLLSFLPHAFFVLRNTPTILLSQFVKCRKIHVH